MRVYVDPGYIEAIIVIEEVTETALLDAVRATGVECVHLPRHAFQRGFPGRMSWAEMFEQDGVSPVLREEA